MSKIKYIDTDGVKGALPIATFGYDAHTDIGRVAVGSINGDVELAKVEDLEDYVTGTELNSTLLNSVATEEEVDEGINNAKFVTAKTLNYKLRNYNDTSLYQGAYGLTWDNVNDTYLRVGANGYTAIQSLMKRCVLNTDGSVNYYLHPTNSNHKVDGTSANLDGTDGNVMVEIPKFWVKYNNTTGAKEMWISAAPAVGYVVHPAFVKNGVEVDYRYYRAYKGSVSGSTLISRSGVAAASSETIAAFRTKAQANGTGWGLVDWHLLHAVQTLLFIEIGTFNSQSVLGDGNASGSDYGMTTGGSNSIGNASSPSTNDDTWMSYRGIENFYGDIFEWIDGVNFSERVVYTSNTQSTFASDVFTGDYTSTGVILPSTGYIKDMDFSTSGFIPTTSGGSDSTYVPDYVFSAAGARVAAFGGTADYGLGCGAACLAASGASSDSSVAVGAGLSF